MSNFIDDFDPEKHIPLTMSQAKERLGFKGKNLKQDQLELLLRGVCCGAISSGNKKTSRSSHEARSFFNEYVRLREIFFCQEGVKEVDYSYQVELLCSEGSEFAKGADAEFRDYVSAQVWAFEKSSGKFPSLKYVCSERGIDRYLEWKEKSRDGSVGTYNIVSPGVKFQASPDQMKKMIFDCEERYLKKMVSRYGSEEEVWKLFGDGEYSDMFSAEFRVSRPVWRKMFLDY